MKKRILSMLLTVVMLASLFAAFPPNVSAVTNSGTCGPNVIWSVTGSAPTISGTRVIPDRRCSLDVLRLSYNTNYY